MPTGTVDLPTTTSPGAGAAQRLDGGLDVAQVGGVLAALLRGADADEVHVRVRGPGGVGGEPQPPGRQALGEQLGQAGLEERRLPPGEGGDLGVDDVDADDVVAEPGHAGRVHGAEVAAAEDRDPHGASLGTDPARAHRRHLVARFVARRWPMATMWAAVPTRGPPTP